MWMEIRMKYKIIKIFFKELWFYNLRGYCDFLCFYPCIYEKTIRLIANEELNYKINILEKFCYRI